MAEEEKKEYQITDLPGVGPTTADKLLAAGLDNLLSIAVSPLGSLVEASGVSEVAARKMIQAARSMLDMGFETGESVLERRKKINKITTGVQAFDEALGGGIETGAISEIYGEYGSGKTQVAHQLAVNVQLPEDQGGLAGEVVYIDTENTFRPERIIQMAEGRGIDPHEALRKIKVARAYNSDHQMFLAEKVEELLKDKQANYRLLVVDSLTTHFRSEYVGRGTLSERQQKLNRHMHTLLKIGDMYNVAVIVTNQVMSKPNVMFGDPTQAIGGHIVGHNSTFRMYIRKGKAGSRVVKIVDSPNLPENEAIMFVHEAGLQDK